MSTRRPHSKSRKGCLECKRRHNKCDEKHPVCSSCARHSVECVWPDVVKQSDGKPSPKTLTPRKRRASSQYLESLEDVSHKLPAPCLDDAAGPSFTAEDMELLHQYSTSTFSTIDTATDQRAIWQDTVIRIGFRHRFLLRGLLALSALHLASTKDRRWLASSSVNFNLAVAEFRQVLESGVNEDNCTAVLLFAATVTMHALAIGQVQDVFDPLADMIQCIRMMKSQTAIVEPFYEVLLNSEIGPVVSNGMMTGCNDPAGDIVALKELLTEYGGNLMLEEDTVYADTIDQLHTVVREARGCPLGRSVYGIVFSWPSLVSEKFLGFLTERRPFAVVILLHFTALVQNSADLWWSCHWHKRIKLSVEKSLSPDLLKRIPE